MTEPATRRFSNALSLGTQCYAATLLQRANLRRFSGPFDWIFSSAAAVRHCIGDDFRTLLDRSQYRPIPLSDRKNIQYERCEHLYYREKFGIRRMFNHHDVWTDDDYFYLDRCVRRFRQVCKQGPVLGVQIRADHLWDARDEFAETIGCLDQYCEQITLCVITIKPQSATGAAPDITCIETSGRHSLHELRSVGQWYATSCEIPADEQILLELLRMHQFDFQPLPGLSPESDVPRADRPNRLAAS